MNRQSDYQYQDKQHDSHIGLEYGYDPDNQSANPIHLDYNTPHRFCPTAIINTD